MFLRCLLYTGLTFVTATRRLRFLAHPIFHQAAVHAKGVRTNDTDLAADLGDEVRCVRPSQAQGSELLRVWGRAFRVSSHGVFDSLDNNKIIVILDSYRKLVIQVLKAVQSADPLPLLIARASHSRKLLHVSELFKHIHRAAAECRHCSLARCRCCSPVRVTFWVRRTSTLAQ